MLPSPLTPANVPADPLAVMPERALMRLARRAARARRRDGRALERLAARVPVASRRLYLLADAWEEGGAGGVVALGPAPSEVDEDAMAELGVAVEAWRRHHYPLEMLHADVWRNRVTIWHLVPGRDRRGDADRRALAHLRLTPDGRWHLYHKAAQGEWWPVRVSGPRREQDVQDCLDAVAIDETGAFWGAQPRTREGRDFWFGPDRRS